MCVECGCAAVEVMPRARSLMLIVRKVLQKLLMGVDSAET